MPRIGSFGLSRRTKYKLELNHVIRVAVNKHVFGETKFTCLRVTSTCSQKNSVGRNKTRQNGRPGIKLPLETIAFYSDSFVARNMNAEQKMAENWARPRTGPHTVSHEGNSCSPLKAKTVTCGKFELFRPTFSCHS